LDCCDPPSLDVMATHPHAGKEAPRAGLPSQTLRGTRARSRARYPGSAAPPTTGNANVLLPHNSQRTHPAGGHPGGAGAVGSSSADSRAKQIALVQVPRDVSVGVMHDRCDTVRPQTLEAGFCGRTKRAAHSFRFVKRAFPKPVPIVKTPHPETSCIKGISLSP
jgi:hypothetical protein